MIRKWKFIRSLYNLELPVEDIIKDFTLEELNEIRSVNKENFEYGALGEFGIRKHLELNKHRVSQNYPSVSRNFWYDWVIQDDYWEVKSQPWWSKPQDLTLQGAENFRKYHNQLSFLLIWDMKSDDILTPLALVDPSGFIDVALPLSNGKTGISATIQVIYENGYLEVLNDEWRRKIL